MSKSDELNDCGCCEDTIPAPALYNPPGQNMLDYRVSVHSSFRERMIARLGSEAMPVGDYAGNRPLRDLTTRAEDDFAMGLIDAMAVIGDVLTFYQERIANEGFLRTATERRSLLAMARAIGYELNPGVAAETYLSFTVDATAGSPDKADIPAGTQVQSIPQKQDELPQTYETMEDFTANAAWNAMRPQMSRPQQIKSTTTELYFKGINLNLNEGDMLVFVKESTPHLSFIKSVETHPEDDRTRVDLQFGSGLSNPAEIYVMRERVGIFGHNATHYDLVAVPEDGNNPFLDWDASGGWPIWKSSVEPEGGIKKETSDAPGGSITLTMPLNDKGYHEDADIYLERVISGILPDSWIILRNNKSGEHLALKARKINETSLAEFALSGKATGLYLNDASGNALNNNDKPEDFYVRTTTVFVKSEPLDLAESPITADLAAGDLKVTVGGTVDGLLPGRQIALSGEDTAGQPVAEIVELKIIELKDAIPGTNETTLHFTAALTNTYVRDTAVLNANVVRAGHGETVSDEALGGGDGARPHQRFTLKKPPLTHVAAETPSGSESALTVRVNSVAWTQVSSLYGLPADAKAYIVRIDDEANASVIFGDGKTGARLPTGQENVRAAYRSGIGQDGEVGAKTLTLLKTRPFGIQGVTNPLPADGAEDPETLEGARDNAPLTVRTLDRIVSLRDYEDFARAFGGIGKAQAVPMWDGSREVVHITVADPTGEPVPDTTLHKLSAAIEAARDPLREFCLGTFEKITFNLQAKVLIDPAYIREEVESAISQALQEAFTFETRAFGQPVSSAEVITIIHTVDGVLAVDLDKLYIDGKFPRFRAVLGARSTTYDVYIDGKFPWLHAVLDARSATYDNTAAHDTVCGRILPAQLLLINPGGIMLLEMMP